MVERGLLWTIGDELDTLCNVALEVINAGIDELLLVGVCRSKDIDGFLCASRLDSRLVHQIS